MILKKTFTAMFVDHKSGALISGSYTFVVMHYEGMYLKIAPILNKLHENTKLIHHIS